MTRIGILFFVLLLIFVGCQNDDDDDDNDAIDDDDNDSDDDDSDDDDDTGPSDVYVSVNGDDADPGTMNAPKRTITAGAALAASGGTVHVAAGTYAESVTVSGVSLLGGYEDAGWTRNIGANQTIIEGVTDQPALTITGEQTKEAVEVGGFTIRGNTSSTSAFGVKIIEGANVNFNENTVTVLQSTQPTKQEKTFPFDVSSFGIYIADSTVEIVNSDISGNSGSPASHLSFALYLDHTTISLFNNNIYGGESGDGSYGVYLCYECVAEIDSNDIDGGLVSGDRQDNATAIYVHNAMSMTIVNNSLHGGEGYGAFGLRFTGCDLVVANNMIDGGTGSYGSGGILILSSIEAEIVNNSIFGGMTGLTHSFRSGVSNGGTILLNNILHAGMGDDQSICILMDYEEFTYFNGTMINNDFYDPDGDCLILDHGVCIDDITEVNACEYLGCVEASGNISADPQWASADDFHLTAGSLCIDAGIDPAPWYAGDLVDYDFDGDPRPSGAGWDIGADEVVSAR